MKSFKKIYAFGFMTIIHPSGQTDKVTIEQLETRLKLTNNTIKELKRELKTHLYDIGKISSKNPIRRLLIKRQVKREQKRTDNTKNT